MQDDWSDWLHFSLQGKHILFEGLPLNSFGRFLGGSLLTIAVCLSERIITLALTKRWSPIHATRLSILHNALWRTALFWLVTLLRLIYMLIVMSYHCGLILIVVTSLAVGQFFIEVVEARDRLRDTRERESYRVKEPLLSSPTSSRQTLTPDSRPRRNSRAKPGSLFIHPNESNLARADAAALELGIAGETERVRANHLQQTDEWKLGKGREVAREMLGSSSRDRSEREPFSIGDDDSDDDS